jgi:hypothetical protein
VSQPFPDAVSSLADVAASRGLSRRLTWVFREHVAILGGTVFVRVPLPVDGFHRARSTYESLVDDDRPVAFGVLCTLGAGTPTEHTACYLWHDPGNVLPSREVIPNPADTPPPEFRVPLHPKDGVSIRSPLLWSVIHSLARLTGTSPLMTQLPDYKT